MICLDQIEFIPIMQVCINIKKSVHIQDKNHMIMSIDSETAFDRI